MSSSFSRIVIITEVIMQRFIIAKILTQKGTTVRIKKTNAILKRPVNKLFLIEYTYHDTNQTDKAREQKVRSSRNW